MAVSPSGAGLTVDFTVAGTQKGGTTALATYLLEHREVCLSTAKEPHFFDTEENFAAEAVDYGRYHAMYAPRPGQRVVGDRTPIYMYWAAAPERIARYNAAMKWILLLREPAARAYSQWNMEVKQGRETLSFEAAIRGEEARCWAAGPLQHRRWSYVDRGRYAVQLRRILAHFPAGQLLVLKSETLQADPEPALAAVANFLGIGPFPRRERRRVFVLPYDQPMSSDARAYLRETFAPDVAELERLLGWDCSDWRR
jgi:hypothetical protein